MSKRIIDCYGHDYRSAECGRPERPIDVDTAANGDIYIRYSAAEICAITRLSIQGTVMSARYTYGAWADRATLEYANDLNVCMEIEVD